MNREQFLEIILPIQEYYGRNMTKPALELYFKSVESWSVEVFGQLVEKHVSDPEQGQFFPTKAHLIRLCVNESDIRTKAAEAFDKNPMIDGTLKYDTYRENYDQRETRKRRYINKKLTEFREASTDERLRLTHPDLKLVSNHE